MKVLFITDELSPYLKTNNLSAFSYSFINAISKNNDLDIKILVPGYSEILKNLKNTKVILNKIIFEKETIELIEGTLENISCPIIVLKADKFYLNETEPNTFVINKLNSLFYKCTLLSMGAYILINNNSKWIPDIVHGNDWHSGLFVAYLNLLPPKLKPKTLFTFHNLMFKGLFSKDLFRVTGLPNYYYNINGIEYYDQISFLKSGLIYSDKITTVSPKYAEEITTNDDMNLRFKDILISKKENLIGVLNGIDYNNLTNTDYINLNNILNDNSINIIIKNKEKIKENFLKTTELKKSKFNFLLTTVSRFNNIKGSNILTEALEYIIPKNQDINVAILGLGDDEVTKRLNNLEKKYPEQVSFTNRYDTNLYHKIISSGDAYIMPSIYEPWGINQLYALKYGNIPIVTPVGGLYDTVKQISINGNKIIGNGFVCENVSTKSLISKINDAHKIFKNKKKTWNNIIKNAISSEFSWENTSKEYLKIYKKLHIK